MQMVEGLGEVQFDYWVNAAAEITKNQKRRLMFFRWEIE